MANFFSNLANTLTQNPLATAATGIGLLGTLFGGGRDPEQITEVIRRMSPEQRRLFQQLQGELGRGDVFETGDILRTTRERFGNELSSSRIGAMQRLRRAGVSPMQIESELSDITTGGLRELGSTLANIEFAGEQAEEARRMDIFRALAGLTSGTGTSTQRTTTSQPPIGAGFAQLFGSGLQGLLRTQTNNTSPQTGGSFRRFFAPRP